MIAECEQAGGVPNHSVQANRRPAAPHGAGSQLFSPCSAPRYFPAAVAHLWVRGQSGIILIARKKAYPTMNSFWIGWIVGDVVGCLVGLSYAVLVDLGAGAMAGALAGAMVGSNACGIVRMIMSMVLRLPPTTTIIGTLICATIAGAFGACVQRGNRENLPSPWEPTPEYG